MEPDIKVQKASDRKASQTHEISIFSKLFLPATLSIVLLLAVGIGTYKRDAIYSYLTTQANVSQSASVESAVQGIGDKLEPFLTKELIYQRVGN
jgi:hypothetical protein